MPVNSSVPSVQSPEKRFSNYCTSELTTDLFIIRDDSQVIVMWPQVRTTALEFLPNCLSSSSGPEREERRQTLKVTAM